jgi:hypothetical protein
MSVRPGDSGDGPRVRGGRTTPDLVLLCLLAASLAGNVYLANRGQHGDFTPSAPRSVAVGTRLGALDVATASGHRESLDLSLSPLPTVLFVYSDSCRWCKRTWPEFAWLARNRAGKYRFLALCVGRGSLGTDPAVFGYTAPSAESVEVLSATTVPQTLLVGRDGRVEQVWIGAYTGATRRVVEAYFGLQLPRANSNLSELKEH